MKNNEKALKIIEKLINDGAKLAGLLGPHLMIGTEYGSIKIETDSKPDIGEGEVLVILRKSTGYTQTDIADYLGIDRVSISQIELGKRKLKLDEAKKLGEMFDLGEFNFFLK